MIARGLIHHPRMLILDEPTAGVDVKLRHGMWKYLKEINAQGTTILLTTHYMEEVEAMCRNCAIIKEGEIVVCDSVPNLLAKAGSLEKLFLEILHDDQAGALYSFKNHCPQRNHPDHADLEPNSVASVDHPDAVFCDFWKIDRLTGPRHQRDQLHAVYCPGLGDDGGH
jgi:ABC-type multidrug transport system ATPase subunit